MNILISYLIDFINTILSAKISYKFNYDILNHIKKIPIKFFYTNSSAYITQRLNSDSNFITNFIINGLKDLFINIIMFISSLYILINLTPKIAFALIILLPFYVVMYKIFKNKIYKANYEYTESQNIFFSEMNMQLDNIKIVKINVLFDILNDRLNNSFNLLFKKSIKSFVINVKFSNIGVITSILANIIILYWGIIEIKNNNITIGQFTILKVYFSNMVNSIKYFLSFSSEYQNIKGAYNRVNEWISIEEENNSSQMIDFIEEIKINGLTFRHFENQNLYENFNYLFSKGNIYKISGRNGTGKSSLINIIIGLYNGQYEGDIEFNGISINKLNIYKVRSNLIGVTEQEPILLEDTILSNITYNLNNIDIDKINELCDLLNLDKFISKLPEGYETILSPKSYNISGGEKQKISLLRTFLKNPNLIILDEITSALDSETITNLKNYLYSIKSNTIIIIIDHNNHLNDIIDFKIDLNNNTNEEYDEVILDGVEVT